MDPVNRENSETHLMGHNGGGWVRVVILDLKRNNNNYGNDIVLLAAKV